MDESINSSATKFVPLTFINSQPIVINALVLPSETVLQKHTHHFLYVSKRSIAEYYIDCSLKIIITKLNNLIFRSIHFFTWTNFPLDLFP